MPPNSLFSSITTTSATTLPSNLSGTNLNLTQQSTGLGQSILPPMNAPIPTMKISNSTIMQQPMPTAPQINKTNQLFGAQSIQSNMNLLGMNVASNGTTTTAVTTANNMQIDTKNHGIGALSAMLPQLNSINDNKSVMNLNMPNFDDPVEQSLASLESLDCKF